MSNLVQARLYSSGDFLEDYIGVDYDDHTRRWTNNVARAKAQGS